MAAFTLAWASAVKSAVQGAGIPWAGRTCVASAGVPWFRDHPGYDAAAESLLVPRRSEHGQMAIFLTAWLIAFLSLSLAVAGLTVAYRLLGSDLRTEGWLRETAIALVTSAIQALLLWAVISLIGYPHWLHLFLAAVIAGLVYRLTHLEDMERLEASVISITQFAIYAASIFLFL